MKNLKRSLLALAMLASSVAAPVTAQVSTVLDPVGDALYHAPAFQDFVSGQITMTPGGDFELLMELAGPVPADPPLPPQGRSEIWWLWGFDLDPAAFPRGYPSAPRAAAAPEFFVLVSWDGDDFAGIAIDRRPLLAGGEAIVTPVPFDIHDTMVEAVLPSDLLEDFPASFDWRLRTIDYSGPAGSAAWRPVDLAGAVFNP